MLENMGCFRPGTGIALGPFPLSKAERRQRGAGHELGVGRHPQLGNRKSEGPGVRSRLHHQLAVQPILVGCPLPLPSDGFFFFPRFFVRIKGETCSLTSFLDPWMDIIQNQVVTDPVMETFCPRATSDFRSSFIEKLLLYILNGKGCQYLNTDFSKF